VIFEMTHPHQEQKQEQESTIIEDGSGLVDEGSKEFGLTQKDYAFLQWDIENQIAKFDEEHGFDGVGYHDNDRSYVYSLDKADALDKLRQFNGSNKRKYKDKVSAQDVAITKGLIKICRPSDNGLSKEGNN
jgi:RecA-family ATPase